MPRPTLKNMNKGPKITIRPSALMVKRSSSTELRVHPKKDIGFKARYNHGREKDSDFSNSDRKMNKGIINSNSKGGISSSKSKLSNQGYTYGSVRVGEIKDNQTQPFQQFSKASTMTSPSPYHSDREEDSASEKIDGPTFGLVNILHEINHTGRKATLQDLLLATEDGGSKHFSGNSNLTSVAKSSSSGFGKSGKPNSVEHFIVQKQMKKIGVKPVKVRHLSKLNSFEFDILNGKDQAQVAIIEENRFPTSYESVPVELAEMGSQSGLSQKSEPLSNNSVAEAANSSSLGFHDSNQSFQENSSKLKNEVAMPSHRRMNNNNVISDSAKNFDEVSASNGCINCKNMLQKLKSQQLSYKNLQRQNGSLENCIAQKRTITDQLTKQVRYLIREYHQLARSSGITPILDEKSLSKITSSTSILKSITDTSLTTGGIITVAEILKSVRNELTKEDSTPVPDQNNNITNTNTDYVQDLQRQLSSVQETCNLLQEQLLSTSRDNTKNKQFLTDLLYTLNTRGYESITELDGSEIDLRRCKGEQLLVLKGKDNRQKSAQKKLAPQDLFMKAIIGSQERAIQTLLQQIDSQQRDSIVGSLLNSETVSVGDADGQRSAALEGEILSLVSLMEGACQRNPDVFKALKEQYYTEVQARESAGVKSNTPVMEIVLERCQRIVSTNTPPKSRVRSKGDSPLTLQTSRSPVSPNRNRDRETSFSENIEQITMKALYDSVEQNSVNTFPESRNLIGRSSYYPQQNNFGAPARGSPGFGGYNKGHGMPNGNDSTNGDMFTNVRFNTNNRCQSPVDLHDAEGLARRNISGSSHTNPFHMLPDEFDSYKYEMR